MPNNPLQSPPRIWSGFGADETQQNLRSATALRTCKQLDDRIAALQAIVVSGDESADASAERQLLVLIGTFAGDVHLWRPKLSHELGRVSDSMVLHSHGDEVTAARFGPAGRRAASCGLDGVLLVSDVRTGMRLMRVQHAAAWCCLEWPTALAAAGDWLLLGDDRGAVSVWDMSTGVRRLVVERAFGGGGGGVGGDGGGVGSGLVSALTACRMVAKCEADGGLVGEERLFVIAAGVDQLRDFRVKVFRVV